MSFDDREYVGRASIPVDRRQFLAAASAAATLGLAGCEGATIDVGGAGPVDLGSAGREELFLAEGARSTESMTVESDTDGSDPDESTTDESTSHGSTSNGPGTDEDTRDVLTSHYVGYHRGGTRDSSSFVQAMLGEGDGSGPGEPATILRVSDAGFESVSLSVGKATGEVDARRVNLLVSASGRREGAIVPAGALALTPLATLQDDGGEWIQSGSSDGNVRPDEVLEANPERLRLVPVEDFFPSDDWTAPGESISDSAVSRWVPGADVDGSGTVLVATGERTVEDVFGTPAEEMPGRQLEEGEAIGARETMLAGPADQFLPGGPIWEWDELLAAGRPAPLGGATYGLGLFVTPRDERADLWPRSDADLEAALQSERGVDLVRSSWIPRSAGPRPGVRGRETSASFDARATTWPATRARSRSRASSVPSTSTRALRRSACTPAASSTRTSTSPSSAASGRRSGSTRNRSRPRETRRSTPRPNRRRCGRSGAPRDPGRVRGRQMASRNSSRTGGATGHRTPGSTGWRPAAA